MVAVSSLSLSPVTCPRRYHNETLLEGTAQGGRLELRGLAAEQAGTYRCKATSEAGSILSEPAQLTVLGERPPRGAPLG